MFQGETAITIDEKGRMAIPTAYRELVVAVCNSRLIATYNPFETGCLWLFPPKEWESVREQVVALPTAKAVHRNLQMKLVGAAAPLDVDGNGRVLLPASQRSAAGIERRAVLLGMGSRFELWSEKAHLAKVRETIVEEQVTPEMAGLRL
jgi:MraZ protein